MMKFKKNIMAIILFISSIAAYSTNSREIYIEGYNRMRYSVEKITASPGEKLTIALKGVGDMDKSVMAHNWVLLKQGTNAMNFVTKGMNYKSNENIDPSLQNKVIAKTNMVGGGEKDSVTFTVPNKKGVYQYVCTFRGHFQAGMKGKLIVQ